MILELIISALFGLAGFLFSALPDSTYILPTGFASGLSNIISSVTYFLPVKALLGMVATLISIDILFVLWRLVLRLKSFVPTWGN